MKKLMVLFILGIILFTACSKSNNTPDASLNETPDSSKTETLYTAIFMNGPHGAVSGSVQIIKDSGRLSLALHDFMSSNGPDLHVYLSQEEQPIHFIELGKLKSTNGNQLYKIHGQPDFKVYGYVLIHCQQYDHLFGIAKLK